MVARAAGDDVDAIDEVELLEGEAQFVDVELAVGTHAAHQRVAHDARLLADLLEHEVGVAALLGHVDVPVHVGDLGLDGVALGVGVLDALGGELGKLAVLEHHDVAGGVDHGDDVGGYVGTRLPLADDDGRVLAGHGDDAGLVGADHGQAVGAHDVRAGLAHGGHEVAGGLVGLLHEVGEDLGVGLALELVAALLELGAQLLEVLHDAVVHDGDAAVAAGVRVGVHDGGLAVGGPAGVADAADGVAAHLLELGLQARDLAHATDDAEARGGPLRLLQGNAGGVIAAVLHAFEAVDKDALCDVRAGIANDSTHRVLPSSGRGSDPAAPGMQTACPKTLPARRAAKAQKAWFYGVKYAISPHNRRQTAARSTQCCPCFISNRLGPRSNSSKAIRMAGSKAKDASPEPGVRRL